jgi:hypothetical protein
MSGRNVPPRGSRLPTAFPLQRGKSRQRRSLISETSPPSRSNHAKKLDSARITTERAGVYLTRGRGGRRGGATAECSRPATRLLSPNVSSRPGLFLDSLCARRPVCLSHPYRERPGLYTVETWRQIGEGTLSPLSFASPGFEPCAPAPVRIWDLDAGLTRGATLWLHTQDLRLLSARETPPVSTSAKTPGRRGRTADA